MALSITAFSITTFSMMTLRITAFRIEMNIMRYSAKWQRVVCGKFSQISPFMLNAGDMTSLKEQLQLL